MNLGERLALTKLLEEKHGGGDVDDQGRRKIYTWIDANVPYYGTYRGKRNLQDKDHPDFRALPLAGK